MVGDNEIMLFLKQTWRLSADCRFLHREWQTSGRAESIGTQHCWCFPEPLYTPSQGTAPSLNTYLTCRWIQQVMQQLLLFRREMLFFLFLLLVHLLFPLLSSLLPLLYVFLSFVTTSPFPVFSKHVSTLCRLPMVLLPRVEFGVFLTEPSLGPGEPKVLDSSHVHSCVQVDIWWMHRVCVCMFKGVCVRESTFGDVHPSG